MTEDHIIIPLRCRCGLVAVRIPTLLGWWWRGLGRPNPFFDGQTRAPISEPRIFAPGERTGLGP